jgi:hypothetical protein
MHASIRIAHITKLAVSFHATQFRLTQTHNLTLNTNKKVN